MAPIEWRVADTKHGRVMQSSVDGGPWQFHHYVSFRDADPLREHQQGLHDTITHDRCRDCHAVS